MQYSSVQICACKQPRRKSTQPMPCRVCRGSELGGPRLVVITLQIEWMSAGAYQSSFSSSHCKDRMVCTYIYIYIYIYIYKYIYIFENNTCCVRRQLGNCMHTKTHAWCYKRPRRALKSEPDCTCAVCPNIIWKTLVVGFPFGKISSPLPLLLGCLNSNSYN
jgi:hypothetical protein